MIMILDTLVLNDDISRCFFLSFFFLLFFVIFIFQAVMGVKGQKMALDEKKVYLLHFISQETHII